MNQKIKHSVIKALLDLRWSHSSAKFIALCVNKETNFSRGGVSSLQVAQFLRRLANKNIINVRQGVDTNSERRECGVRLYQIKEKYHSQKDVLKKLSMEDEGI